MSAVKILTGNAIDKLRELPDQSVHCCITSPPYWGLRSYKGDPGMIGMEPTFDEHLDNLVSVFREVRRVLRDDGTLWLNYGDAYAGSWGNYHPTGEGGQRDKQTERWDRPAYGDKTMLPPAAKTKQFKPKDLMMMPARVAMALQQPWLKCKGCLQVNHKTKWGIFPNGRLICPSCEKSKGSDIDTHGWWLRSEIIWHKPNPMPESVTDRPTSAHEKIYLLAKSPRYFYDVEAVRTPMADSTIERLSQPGFDLQQGGPKDTKTGNRSHRKVAENLKKKLDPWHGGKFDRHGHERHHYEHRVVPPEQQTMGANLRNVWKISTHSYPGSHFATFPPDLVEPCIKAGTSEKGVCGECGAPWVRLVEKSGGSTGKSWHNHEDDQGRGNRTEGRCTTAAWEDGSYKVVTAGWNPPCNCNATIVPAKVLDPFCGAGTVGLVASRLQRDAILIEISSEYADMSRKRIYDDAPLFAEIT